MPAPSKIFTGYRALGFVSNHVPLQIRHHFKHKENYVVTSVGKAFHTYNCSRLGIVAVSNSHPFDIECLAINETLVFTSYHNLIRAYEKNTHVIHVYDGHKNNVQILLPFGHNLISVDDAGHVIIWDIKTEGIYLELQFENKSFQITCLLHPSTYLNKLLFASKQGAMQLWNIKSNKLLYTFPGWGKAITVLEQAPAIDVVAIGLSDGEIILHNIRFDETIVKFRQDWGAVTAISFRTDGHPIMVSGSTAGHIALWNLEEKKLQSQIRDAHNSTITGLQCLPNEPLLTTSSPDNSLKVWIFDLADGGGRLLRERSGHSAPPNIVEHYGKNGQNILSAGQDSTLRSFSVVHDKHNKSLGRASYNKAKSRRQGLKHDTHEMPPIIHFTSEPCRQSDWDNIVACHRNVCVATTWSYQRATMGEHMLKHSRFKSGPDHCQATALCADITSCGNFVVIGYSSGHVDIYNLQSGLHRGSVGNPQAHNDAVRGLCVDSLNQIVVTGGADGCIKFWRFKTKEALGSEIKLDSYLSHMKLHRESSMLAVSLDNFSVVIIDIDTRNVVRSFTGHTNVITDMTYSPDARWFVTSSMDSSVRIWDMPTGRLVDCFLVDLAVTSMSFSPTGDFLATSHVDDIGVYLWSNMTLFTHVSLRPLPSDYVPVTLHMPAAGRLSQEQEEESSEEIEKYEMSEFKSREQISNELITLSLLPNSRWQNLLDLDVIKQRNKPKEPPKAPKAAPFFLPTIPGLEPTFAYDDDSIDKDKESSKLIPGSIQPLSDLGKIIVASSETDNYDPALNYMKKLGPSAIDVEIRSLAPEGGGSISVMCSFLKLVENILESNKNFEIINAYLGLFLQVHGELITQDSMLSEAAAKLSSKLDSSWINLQTLFTQTLCLTNYLRSATL